MGSFGALAPKDSGAVLAEKLTAEHISEEQRQQAAEDARVHTRWIVGACLYTGVVVVVLCFAAFLVHRLADTNPTLLMEILKSVTLFAGGLGAGWGIAKVRQNRQDDEE